MTKRTTNKKRKPLTQEEKQAKRDAVKAACEDIKKGMREIASSGEWQNFLNVYSAFHQYSMNNVWLIQTQMADPMNADCRRFKVRHGAQAIRLGRKQTDK